MPDTGDPIGHHKLAPTRPTQTRRNRRYATASETMRHALSCSSDPKRTLGTPHDDSRRDRVSVSIHRDDHAIGAERQDQSLACSPQVKHHIIWILQPQM